MQHMACFPIKWSVALCAPHLITTLYLVNTNATRRTWACLVLDERCSGNVRTVAFMFLSLIGLLHNQTLFACRRLAHSTLPIIGQKATAVIHHAMLYKQGFVNRLDAPTIGPSPLSKLVQFVLESAPESHDFSNSITDSALFQFLCCCCLSFRQQAVLKLQQDVGSMIQKFVLEGECSVSSHKSRGPWAFACCVHTVWVLGSGQQICAHACCAWFEHACRTLDCSSCPFVVRLDTHGTTPFVHLCI